MGHPKRLFPILINLTLKLWTSLETFCTEMYTACEWNVFVLRAVYLHCYGNLLHRSSGVKDFFIWNVVKNSCSHLQNNPGGQWFDRQVFVVAGTCYIQKIVLVCHESQKLLQDGHQIKNINLCKNKPKAFTLAEQWMTVPNKNIRQSKFHRAAH